MKRQRGLQNFWSRWRHRSICFASSHNQKKDNNQFTNQFKNKNQPELPENRTVWKPDNQGVKEETFIQTDRRGRDWQPGQRGCKARQLLVDRAVPHSCADKLGGTTGEQDRPHNPGFQCRGNKASKPLTEKTCDG